MDSTRPPRRPRTTAAKRPPRITVDVPTGVFALEGSGFTADGIPFLLRERERPKPKQPPYFLLARGAYLSGLWPQTDGTFRLDNIGTDGVERVYRLRFDPSEGTVTITGGELSKRARSVAPWRPS